MDVWLQVRSPWVHGPSLSPLYVLGFRRVCSIHLQRPMIISASTCIFGFHRSLSISRFLVVVKVVNFMAPVSVRALRISRERLFWHFVHILPQDTLWWTVSKILILNSSPFLLLKTIRNYENGVKVRLPPSLMPQITRKDEALVKFFKFNQLLLSFNLSRKEE